MTQARFLWTRERRCRGCRSELLQREKATHLLLSRAGCGHRRRRHEVAWIWKGVRSRDDVQHHNSQTLEGTSYGMRCVGGDRTRERPPLGPRRSGADNVQPKQPTLLAGHLRH